MMQDGTTPPAESRAIDVEKIDIDQVQSAVLRRLIAEVRADQEQGLISGYNRVYNRYMGGGKYNRVYSRHNR